MCGLIGVINKWSNGFNASSQKAFFDLLYMDTLRGPDSTGVALIEKDGAVRVIKDSVPGYEFLQTKEYQTHIDTPGYKDGKALIGHNRKATQGKITAYNAHPFTVEDQFVLAHNGTLTSHKHLDTHDVDSQAIADYLFNNWKDDATPEEKANVLAHIGGAWALIWYDLRTDTYNVVRNHQRPLTIVETHSDFFIGSEHDMLVAGVTRNSNTIVKTIKVEPYTVYSWDLSTNMTQMKEVVLPTGPFLVSQPVTQVITHTLAATVAGDVKLTKNKFKCYLRNLIGKPINFYVEDFVNRPGVENQWYFYGESYDLSYLHEIVGLTQKDKVEVIEDAYNLAQGVVLDGVYDKKTGKAKLTVKIVGPYVHDSTTTDKVIQ